MGIPLIAFLQPLQSLMILLDTWSSGALVTLASPPALFTGLLPLLFHRWHGGLRRF